MFVSTDPEITTSTDSSKLSEALAPNSIYSSPDEISNMLSPIKVITGGNVSFTIIVRIISIALFPEESLQLYLMT